MGPDLGASLVREALSFTHDHGIDTQGEAMQEEPGGSFQAQGRAGGLFLDPVDRRLDQQRVMH